MKKPAVSQSSWQWTSMPYLYAVVYLLFGLGGICVGVVAPRDIGFMFHAVFVGLGAGMVGCAFILPATGLRIDSHKQVLVRTCGPWPGFRTQSTSIPLGSICSVVLFWNLGETGGEENCKRLRLFLRDVDGKEWDIFPPNWVPAKPTRFARKLAEVLHMTYCEEGQKAKQPEP